MHYTFFSSPFFLNILLPACQDQFNQGDVKRSDIYTLQTQVILVDGVLMVYTEEMERAPSGASGVLSRQTSEKWGALSRMAFAHFGRQIYILLIGKSFVLLGIAQISPFNVQWNSPQYGVQHTRTLGAVDDDVGDFLDGGGDNRYQISVRMTELY